MWHTPFIRKTLSATVRTLVILSAIIALVLGLELLKAFRMFWQWHHAVGALFALGVGLVGLWLGYRAFVAWSQQRALIPPPSPEEGATGHADLVEYCRFLIHLLKRASLNPLFSAENQQAIRQKAYDIEEVLSSHPLPDDLTRAIQRTKLEVLGPIHAEIRTQAEALARERMRAVVEDVVEPPFPVINPFVVFYVQITLVSRIADLYFLDLSLLEYLRIMRDVFNVLVTGRFFKLGQNLFAGVYANSPPLGRAIDDLGQSLTSIWLTSTVSRATMLRCEALTEWNEEAAAREMDRQVVDLLTITKDCLIRDAMPILRLRIRHSAPPGTPDAVGFSESVAEGITRAVDAVVKGCQSQPPGKAAAAARRTLPGSDPASAAEAQEEPVRIRRRRHSRRSRGLFSIFRTLGQRIKYSSRPGHS